MDNSGFLKVVETGCEKTDQGAHMVQFLKVVIPTLVVAATLGLLSTVVVFLRTENIHSKVDYGQPIPLKDLGLSPFFLAAATHSGESDSTYYLDPLTPDNLGLVQAPWFYDDKGFRSIGSYVMMSPDDPRGIIYRHGSSPEVQRYNEAIPVPGSKDNEFYIKFFPTSDMSKDRYLCLVNSALFLLSEYDEWKILKFKAIKALPRKILSLDSGFKFKLIKDGVSWLNWLYDVCKNTESWVRYFETIRPASDLSLAWTVKEVNGKLEIGLEKASFQTSQQFEFHHRDSGDDPVPRVEITYSHKGPTQDLKGQYTLDQDGGKLVLRKVSAGSKTQHNFSVHEAEILSFSQRIQLFQGS